MNRFQTVAAQKKGALDFLWTVYAFWMLGGTFGVVAGWAFRGAEMLSLPAWMWSFAAISATGAGCFYVWAAALGNTKGVRSVSKYCALLLLVMALGFSVMGGFDGGSAGQDADPWSRLQWALGHFAALMGLVFAPAIAFIANGWCVLELYKRRAAATQ